MEIQYCFEDNLQCMGKDCPAPCRIILDNVADGVFTVGMDFKIAWFNRAAERITGFSKEEVLGKPCYQVFKTALCHDDRCPLKMTITSGRNIIDLELEILNQSGEPVPVSVSASPIRNKAGELIGAVETFRDLTEIRAFQEEIQQRYSFRQMISKNARMMQIFDNLKDIAVSDTPVLIRGDSGTGKELLAKAIHDLSPRSERPYVTVNCGALPHTLMESELFGYKKGAFTDARKDKPGRFSLAQGGTLFLDEIGDLSLEVQGKLLRVLQDGEYQPLGSTETLKADVRIISATNKDLFEMVQEGRFREDLFYRINVVQIDVPSLRDRKEDIPLLVDHFIQKFNKKMGKNIKRLSAKARDILVTYDFPGNIRELENIIEHGFILCKKSVIEPEHLPPYLTAPKQKASSKGKKEDGLSELDRLERETILENLRRNRWRRQKTAESLGLSRTTLWRKLKKMQLVP